MLDYRTLMMGKSIAYSVQLVDECGCRTALLPGAAGLRLKRSSLEITCLEVSTKAYTTH